MPLPHLFEPPNTPAELARLPRPTQRPALAALVPRLILRVSYRGTSTVDGPLFDSDPDPTRWLVPLGFTFEARASWTIDRVVAPIPLDTDDLDLDPEDDR